jgi:hypothetical protein
MCGIRHTVKVRVLLLGNEQFVGVQCPDIPAAVKVVISHRCENASAIVPLLEIHPAVSIPVDPKANETGCSLLCQERVIRTITVRVVGQDFISLFLVA